MRALVVTGFTVLMSAGAYAQGSYTVEEVAQVRDTERAEFVASSVREFRGEQLFDVLISYADPANSPPGGTASRIVSYRARCGDGADQLAISRITLRDIRGRMMKMITVPPGGEDFLVPENLSREGDWLYRVCG